jgi:hypothetical protein
MRRRTPWLGAVALLALVACGKNNAASQSGAGGNSGGGMLGAAGADAAGGAGASGGAGGTAAIAFQPVSPYVYVAKIKNLLLGLPASDAEVNAVAADPAQLKVLIAAWMQQPQYAAKMQRFFELAFQQTQVSATDFSDQTYPKQLGLNAGTIPLLVQNAEESFARTMLALLASGQPLSAGMTTHQLMMTTALKELYAFLDVWQVDDAGKTTDAFKKANPKLQIVVESAAGPIPITDTLDPSSPNYMHWYDPDVTMDAPTVAGCAEDPITLPVSAASLHYLLYGSLDGHKSSGGVTCPPMAGAATATQFLASDFTDWTLVTLRQPAPGEATTTFYDLPALRAATELVLGIPRQGFFSTPAFFANWQTNTSNQMRVTLNQSLIVGLGASVDGTDPTPVTSTPGLDTVHSANAACSFCHKSLDPLRSIFAATYSWNYHDQLDATWSGQKGVFAFQGVVTPVSTMDDFGAALATHPLFAQAWVQKLCAYANSVPCQTDDPEFQRVVSAFQGSGLSWDALIQELFASPLVTHAAETATADATGEVIAVARRDHLCAALDNRLGFADVCGLNAVTKKQMQATVAQIASGLPSDGYGRGANFPVLPNQPTLFYRAATENLCSAVADQVIDPPAAKQVAGVKVWSSTAVPVAIADFVGTVMALAPSDPRAAPATTLLQAHYDSAMQQGVSRTNALKSTFITACLAPSATAIGM